jgi:integrase
MNEFFQFSNSDALSFYYISINDADRNVNIGEKNQNSPFDNTYSNPSDGSPLKPHGWAWYIGKKNEKMKDIPSLDDMRDLINNIPNLEDKALIAVAYLTAGRVSEIVKQIRRGDFYFGPWYGVNCMLVKMPNLKHKWKHRKDIPIPIDKEKDLVDLIRSYIETLPSSNTYLFDFSRVTAWKKIRKYCNFTSHWLRHIRLTHMATVYNFNDQKLVILAGWTDSRPAKYYMELRSQDILY